MEKNMSNHKGNDPMMIFSKKPNANIGVLKRSLRKQAKDMYWNYKPKDAVDGPMGSRNPPKEGYYFEYFVMSWVPMTFDKDAFIKERDAVIEAEYQRLLDITPNPNNPGFSLSGKVLTIDGEEATGIEDNVPTEHEETTATVRQEQWYTSIIVEPNNETQPKESSSVNDGISKSSSEPGECIPPGTIPESFDESAKCPTEEEMSANTSSDPASEPQLEAVEQSRKTRRSAKMVEADFDTLAAQFICPTELAEKKPLFFPERIRESLRKIAGLVPGGKVSPSHIAIHVIEAWIDEHRKLFNRMFANQKTSI